MTATDGTLGVVRAWLDAFNDGERERFREWLHPEVVFAQRAIDQEERGAERVDQSYWSWRAHFLGLHGEIRDAFAAGERAAAEIEWRGVHREAGVEVRFLACFLFRVRGERIAEIVDFYDQLSFLRQLRP